MKRTSNTITDSPEISRTITRFQNIDENEIMITESKLENILLKHSNALKSGSDWKTPLGLVVAIITFFLTAEFNKDFLSLKAYEWKVFFFIILLLCLYWFVKSLFSKWKHRGENLESLIKQIKNEGEKNEVLRIEEEEKGLKIIKALYGIAEEGKEVDVTNKLDEAIKEGKLVLNVNNGLVPTDPAPGIVKRLAIQYEYNGESLSTEIPERGSVSLP